jgi:Rieske Fe-S protein
MASLLIRDLILKGESPWSKVYDPGRPPPAGGVNFISENATAIKNFAEYLMPGELSSVDELAPGQGGVLRDGLHRIAACKDMNGKLHLHSAVCTHLGCHIHWNSTEQCWDCPCHGSHFAPDGAVLNGPALAPLKPATLPADRKTKAGTH